MKINLIVAFTLLCHVLSAQEQKITARIVEPGTEKSVAEAKITIEGTTISTFTNHLGWFELMVDRAQHKSINVSHISYKLLQVQIPAQDRFKLYLERDTVRLKPLNLNDYAGTPVAGEQNITGSGQTSDEAEARYPGGWSELYKTIGTTLHPALPAVTEKGFVVNFTISETGQPVDIEVSEPSAKETVVAAFQKMPAWTPAMQHQKNVKQQFMMQICRFAKVELQKGDMFELTTFINRQIRYPAYAKRMGLEGPTFTQFTVDEFGNVIDILLLEGLDASCNSEVKRVISIIPSAILKTLSEKTHERLFILPVLFGLGKPLKEGREYKLEHNAYLLPAIDVMAGELTVVRRELGNGRITSIPAQQPVIVIFTTLNEALVQPRNAQRLTLRNDKLTAFPTDILTLTNLTFLDLEQNQITSLPEDLDALTNLERLYLLQNKLTDLPDKFANLKKLRTLGLSNNLFSVFPASLTSLEKLEVLDMSNNQLTEIPATIKQMKNLETIALMNNKITRIPPEFLELRKLKRIYLNGNPISADDIQLLKQTFKKAEIEF
ncbi:MAG TPA: leucine-rich repeat domain-containing protein [Cyclobacteriaceae bacterium]|nr:leucine-rich repeat domain-containing protein [Cyclobacteriaceae bacterium]HMV08757.1 leucine-rich repeat domain-containing protein [Cyclobacteriaceae bacterium]HMV90215.1 leucine-rich repeat domain-containing protein [Cyclobacteriaceae bacterium]HMW99902.1 leucine-rich repeat domain-containing protein [Cyclobacteriaceae bacterium]HMX49235.1 leucine-rich repeat domain-containing protein [Cyclobacteriaceae bacterium]